MEQFVVVGSGPSVNSGETRFRVKKTDVLCFVFVQQYQQYYISEDPIFFVLSSLKQVSDPHSE